MNILVINHYAGAPSLGMEFRPYYLAKEWIRLGHSVTIIAATYSHVRSKQPTVVSDLQCDNIDDIAYFWLKIMRYKNSGFKRILSILMFVGKLLIYRKRIASLIDPDIVIASSTYPLDIYPAYLIARKNKAKLIYEVHDLWPLSPIELGGYSKHHPFILIMQWAENFAYKHCDKVVSLLPMAKQHMVEHGLKEDKFCHVPNGIVLADWNNPKELPETHKKTIDQLRNTGKFLIGFAGAHGIANSLHSIISAAAGLAERNVALILVGTGQEKRKLISWVEKADYRNIYFLDPIDKYAIPTFLKQMDVLVVGLKKESLFRYGISPNKIFDYMMASKPIIQAIEAGNNLISDADCGIYVEPENIDAIAEAIVKLQTMSAQERLILGENGYNYVRKHHTYNILAKNFLNL